VLHIRHPTLILIAKVRFDLEVECDPCIVGIRSLSSQDWNKGRESSYNTSGKDAFNESLVFFLFLLPEVTESRGKLICNEAQPKELMVRKFRETI
jgi:hypothetical protein